MTAAPVSDVKSLSQRIRNEIAAKILSGEWKPGHRIPIETELALQYGCARMTVSRAAEALADDGLIVRRRRLGSFVAQPKVQSAVLEIPDIQAIVNDRGERYCVQLISREVRKPSSRAEEAQLAGNGDLLEVACLHLANDEPFALEKRLISLAAVPDARDADFSSEPPGTWLLGHVPWTEAEHRIFAQLADAETAHLLEVGLPAACLTIERKTWRGDQHITWVRQTFPSDVYHLIARFEPRAQEHGRLDQR